MKSKNIIAKGIQVVTFLFAGFGDFLFKVAPPGEADSSFAVGISSLLTLFVLLFISAVTKNYNQKVLKNIWLSSTLLFFITTMASAAIYKEKLTAWTFSYPPETPQAQYISGTVLTSMAEEYKFKNPQKTVAEIVAAFGGLASLERVWTRDSIGYAKEILTVTYVLMVLSVSFMLFSLTEGLLVERTSQPK